MYGYDLEFVFVVLCGFLGFLVVAAIIEFFERRRGDGR